MKGMGMVTMILNTRLMYLDFLVSRSFTMIMVDTSATHNFILVEEEKRLGLIFKKGDLYMKVVNL